MAMDKPLKTIVTSVEGVVTYKALLFIPSVAPYDYYTKEYKKGLQLYSSGVLIMDNCEELLPEHFRFVKGIVDSADLSLNISREMLQHDRHLITIAQNIEKKIKNELTSMLQNDRENYENSSTHSADSLNTVLFRTTVCTRKSFRTLLCSILQARKSLLRFRNMLTE